MIEDNPRMVVLRHFGRLAFIKPLDSMGQSDHRSKWTGRQQGGPPAAPPPIGTADLHSPNNKLNAENSYCDTDARRNDRGARRRP
jgi:hypothetical protein